MSYTPDDLAEARARWAERPRRPGWAWWSPFRARDRVVATQDRQRRRGLRALYREGEVVWGHVFLAHTQLFEGGGPARGAWVLWSLVPEHQATLERYAELGERLGKLYDADEPPPGLLGLRLRLRAPEQLGWRWRLPEHLTRGEPVWVSFVVLHPGELPGGRILVKVLPFVVQPSGADTEVMVPLPLSMWPERTRARWEAAPRAR